MQKWEYKTLVRQRSWDVVPNQNRCYATRWNVLEEDTTQLPESITLIERAKQLGEEGWELVAVVPFSSVLGGTHIEEEHSRRPVAVSFSQDYAGFTTEEKWVFKRPRG